MLNPDSKYCPVYQKLNDELYVLLTSFPPPFIYINDPFTWRLTSSIINATLVDLSQRSVNGKLRFACIDGISAFTPRIFYDSVLNALARHTPRWDTGCLNWHSEGRDERYNETFGGFVKGLQALHITDMSIHDDDDDQSTGSHNKKEIDARGKCKAVTPGEPEIATLVIFIDQAEKMRATLPDLVVPLTRLSELSDIQTLSVVLLSPVRWEEIRPSLGASPEPYYIDVEPLNRSDTINLLTSHLSPIRSYLPSSALHETRSYTDYLSNLYRPSFSSLYTHFITHLVNVCYPFTHDPYEISYVAAARWPGFIKAALNAQSSIDENGDAILGEYSDDGESTWERQKDDIPNEHSGTWRTPAFSLPDEQTRIRLLREFTPSMTLALETLYPRLTNATEWVNKADSGDESRRAGRSFGKEVDMDERKTSPELEALTRMSKFVLVASFIASTNPPKTDLRMFGRGLSGRSKKMKKGLQRQGKSGVTKVPQRLLGPSPFPMDRMLAVLGALLEENDADSRLPDSRYNIPGEYTDMEVSRIGISATINSLASVGLLYHTSSPERLDGPPTFKCGISYERTLELAKDIGVPLGDLIWEAM